MSSKLSLTNSQFYLKITPLLLCLPPLRPAVCLLASRPLYPHMIMCKNAIAACNDKNVWVQSVYIFPLFTNEKKMGYGCYAFFLPQKLTPLSLYILISHFISRENSAKKMNMIFFFRNTSKFENNCLCISKTAGYLIFQYTLGPNLGYFWVFGLIWCSMKIEIRK